MKANIQVQGLKRLVLSAALAVVALATVIPAHAGDDRHGDDTGGALIRQFDSKRPKVKSIAPIVQRCSLELVLPIAEHALGETLPSADDKAWKTRSIRGFGSPLVRTFDVLGSDKDATGRLKTHYYLPETLSELVLPSGDGLQIGFVASVVGPRGRPWQYKDLPSTDQKPNDQFAYLSDLADRGMAKLQVSRGPIKKINTDQYSFGQIVFDMDKFMSWAFQTADGYYDGQKAITTIDLPKVIFDRESTQMASIGESEVKNLRIQSAPSAGLFVDSAAPVKLWSGKSDSNQVERGRLIKGAFVPTQLQLDFEGYEACVRAGLSEL